jgi:CheY-like chemotaxis protein
MINKKKQVLLIDDNDIDNYITNHIIARSQIAEKITIKKSAIEALEYLESIKENIEEFPEIIFLDIKMPMMDGFEFLDELIKFPIVANKHCEVLMLSSSNDQNDIDRAFEYSIVKKYFTKPLKMEMLVGFPSVEKMK